MILPVKAMNRSTLALVVLGWMVMPGLAQVVIRHAPRPAGIIPPPQLPIPGALQFGPPVVPTPVAKAPPYFATWLGYPVLLPGWWEPPRPIVQNTIIVPPSEPPMAAVLPPPREELRARLTLNVPSGARVWLAGREVDAAATPLILESPPLTEDQSYTFDLKITWVEGSAIEERRRSVKVPAGENRGLTYTAAR